MGLDYEYQLYFPREQMWNVLESIAAMAKPVGETKIILPDREIILPFTSNFENKTIIFDESIRYLSFSTCLYFDSDEIIEEYVADSDVADEIKRRWRDEKGRISIGYIDIRAYTNPFHSSELKQNLCGIHINANFTHFSLLFEQSNSIRKAFEQLLEKHDGLVGYFMDSENPLNKFYAFWPSGISLEDAKKNFLMNNSTSLFICEGNLKRALRRFCGEKLRLIQAS